MSAVPHPFLELMSRYRAVLAHAWTHRSELAGPKRLADEAAFLPAALSLQDTPVHPAPRRLAWGLMALFVIALVWACLGQVDIVASAPGRIIVSERTKVIQPLEASVVKRVLVKDGDRVQAGQVLVELDPTLAQADSASVQEQIKTQTSELYRARALLGFLELGFLGSDSNMTAQRSAAPAGPPKGRGIFESDPHPDQLVSGQPVPRGAVQDE